MWVAALSLITIVVWVTPANAQNHTDLFLVQAEAHPGPAARSSKAVQLSKLKQELDRLYEELSDLLTQFNDRHPDVIQKRSDIFGLEREITRLMQGIVRVPIPIYPECQWGSYWPWFYEKCGAIEQQLPPIALPPIDPEAFTL